MDCISYSSNRSKSVTTLDRPTKKVPTRSHDFANALWHRRNIDKTFYIKSLQICHITQPHATLVCGLHLLFFKQVKVSHNPWSPNKKKYLLDLMILPMLCGITGTLTKPSISNLYKFATSLNHATLICGLHLLFFKQVKVSHNPWSPNKKIPYSISWFSQCSVASQEHWQNLGYQISTNLPHNSTMQHWFVDCISYSSNRSKSVTTLDRPLKTYAISWFSQCSVASQEHWQNLWYQISTNLPHKSIMLLLLS